MKVFKCTNHDSHYPVGCASVIIARDWNEAVGLLDGALKTHGLKPRELKTYTLEEITLDAPKAIVLNDGDY